MKKNFSFLKKAAALSAVALTGALAWAYAPAPSPDPNLEAIWTTAKEINVGDEIVFYAKDSQSGKINIFKNDGQAEPLVGDMPIGDGIGFKVTEGYKYGQKNPDGTTNTDKSFMKDTQYLYEELDIIERDHNAEVTWKVKVNTDGSTEVLSASNKPRYIYYDVASKSFQVTMDPKQVSFFVKTNVGKPVFTPNEACESVSKSTNTWNVKVDIAKTNVPAVDKNSKIQYIIYTADVTSGEPQWTAVNSEYTTVGNSANINIADYKNKFVKIAARTSYEGGYTSVVESQIYHLYTLDPAVITPKSGDLAITDEGKAMVSISADPDCDLTYTVTWMPDNSEVFNVVAEDIAYQNSIDLVEILKGAKIEDILAGKVKVTAKTSRNGHKNSDSKTVSEIYQLKYNTDNSAYSRVLANPDKDARKVGDVIELSLEVLKQEYNGERNPDIATVTLEDEDGNIVEAPLSNPVTAAGNPTFTVPEDFKLDDEGNAKAFTATVKEGTWDVTNYVFTFPSPETTFTYGTLYKKVTWTINPYRRDIDTDHLETTFNLYPSNGTHDENVEFYGNPKVKVTFSNNEEIPGATVTKVTDTKNEFLVSIPSEAADYYFDPANGLVGKGLMVAFEKEALRSDDGNGKKTINSNTVTGYIEFHEAVEITFEPVEAFAPICEHQKSISLKANGKGKKTQNTYDVELNGEQEVTITGTNIKGEPVNVKAPIVGTKNEFTIDLSNAGLIQADNNAYNVEVPAEAFKSSLTYSDVFGLGLDVLAHPSYSASTTEKIVPTNKITVDILATVPEGETIEIDLDKTNKFGVTVDGKTPKSTKFTQTTSATGKVEIELSEELGAGDHTIVFADGAFKANLCPSGANDANNLTISFEVEEVEWTFGPNPITLSDKDTEFDITVAATFDGEALDVTRNYGLPFYLAGGTNINNWFKIKGAASNVYSVSFKSVDVNTKVATYTVKMKNPLTADDVLVIAKNDFKANGRSNPETELPIVIQPYITYGIENAVHMVERHKDGNTTVYYKVYGTIKGGKEYIPAGVIDYAEITEAGKDATEATAAAFNNGYGPVFPEIKKIGADKPNAENVKEQDANVPGTWFSATFPCSAVEQNNYQINFPEGTLYAPNNANDDKLFVNFRVFNEIAITLEPEEHNIDTDVETITIQIKGYDVIDEEENYDAKLAEGTPITIDGIEVEYVPTGNPGEFDVTLPTGDKKLGEGSYELSIPAGKVTANASINKDPLTSKVNIFPVPTFKGGEITIWASESEEFTLEEVVTGVEIKSSSMDQYSSTGFVYNGVEFVDGDVNITTDGLEKGDYKFTIPAGHLAINSSVNKTDIVWTIHVINGFNFYDAFASEVTTTPSDYVAGTTYDEFTYNRTFGTTKPQAMYLPFNMKAGDVADYLSIARFNAVTEQDGEMTFWFTTLKNDEIAYANKPYIVTAKQTGDITIQLNGTQLLEAKMDGVESSTTKQWYDMSGNPEAWTLIEDAFILSGGSLKPQKAGSNQRAWRWIMTSVDKSIQYVKVRIDGVEVGDEEATAIMGISEIPSDAVMYTVAGQRIATPVKNSVIIINGKKTYIK